MSDYRPTSPAYSRSTELATFRDACAHVAEVFNLTAGDVRATRLARAAVLEAYRDLPTMHDWAYFERRGQVTTAPSQFAGTVAYDHTGGAYERQVTLSGAAWPEDVRFYRLLLNQVSYRVENRVSATVVTLEQDSNPGEDVAATGYDLYRSEYPLPIGCRRLSGPVAIRETWGLRYIAPDQWLRWVHPWRSPGDPLYYTIRDSGEHYGGLVLEFMPPPNAARAYEFMYESSPRPLRLFGSEEYSTGTASVSGTTVSGSGTAWSGSMVGSVLRFSSTNAAPTGLSGPNPFAEQRIVTAVGGATSLTIDAPLSGAYSGVGHSIGDPLDVEATAMLTCLLRLAEMYFAQKTQIKNVRSFETQFSVALRVAKGADNRQRDTESRPAAWPVWGLTVPPEAPS